MEDLPSLHTWPEEWVRNCYDYESAEEPEIKRWHELDQFSFLQTTKKLMKLEDLSDLRASVRFCLFLSVST